jgi:hypothetical protein
LAAFPADAVVGRPQEGELVVAADERGRDGGGVEGLALSHDEPSGIRLLDRAKLEGRARGARGALGNHDRPGLGGLLQPRSEGDGVAGDAEVVARRTRGERLARAHADTKLERLRRLARVVPAPEALDHPARGAHGAHGVVLVNRRYPEDGHDRLPGEPLDRSAFGLDLHRHGAEEVGQQVANVFGVPRRPPRIGLDDVGDEDGHELQHLVLASAGGHVPIGIDDRQQPPFAGDAVERPAPAIGELEP